MDAILGEFQERGFATIRGLFEPSVVASARAELEKLVDGEASKLLAKGAVSDPLEDEPFETRLYRLYEKRLDDAPDSFRPELHLAGLFGMFFNRRLLDVVETILGSEIRLYPNYTARAKLPDWEGSLVLWHQDGGYTETVSTGEGGLSVDKMRMVNVWTPLVPARVENGCMQFIPGTHRLGVVPHVKKKYYLEIAREVLEPRLKDAVDIELDPGDVVVFHNLLFHCGQPNRTKKIRWSLDWRYQDASQPTLRRETGHIARSAREPSRAVRSAEQWASLSFV